MLRKIACFVVTAGVLAGCAPKVDTVPVARPTATVVTPPKKVEVAAEPEIKAEELVAIETLTSNRVVLADKPGELVVRLHLRAKARKGARRPPINLALVVDTSGSMEGAAIEDARTASLKLLDSLSEGDRLSLIVFHSAAEVLVPSTKLTKETIAQIREKIGTMKASGTTDLAGGLAAGLAQARNGFQADGINRVVLLGDGIPNDPASLPGQALSAAQMRIPITALGLGLEQDETLMSKIALSSGGKYHFIQESAQVAKVFADEVLRLKDVTGRATVVALKPGPGVVVKEVIGLPFQRVGQGAQLVLGDMSEDDERDLLVRLEVPARRAGSVVELLDADVSVDHPKKPGTRLSERAFVSVKSTADAAAIDGGRDRDVEHAVARLSVADAIVRAVAAARTGDVKLGRAILDRAEKEAKSAAKAFDDEGLAEKAKTIAALKKSLASMAPPPAPLAPPVRPVPPAKHSMEPDAQQPDPSRHPVPGADSPTSSPAPVAPRPAGPTPAIVMKSQADAMRTIQGL